MKISLSIPQYNRIGYLLKSLSVIELQTYEHIEVVISDDCSTDDTEQQIKQLMPAYKYPVVYKRNQRNLGYDRNYRQSIELATGDYCFILGNDDTLSEPGAIEYLAGFLEQNNFPDIGVCNFHEQGDPQNVYKRANTTGISGTGYEIAMKYYSCFSFVAGLIYKRETFLKYNTAAYDGSIYAQMYLGCFIISKGGVFFLIEKSLVLKDILLDGNRPNNYRQTLAQTWKEYKVVDGGLPSVMNVLVNAFKDAGVLTQDVIYRIHRKVYLTTYPHWLLDYREQHAFPEAVGLSRGVKPWKTKTFKLLSAWNKFRISFIYRITTVAGLLTPVFIFRMVRVRLYHYIKK
ncbi:MAG: glycosyltransferase family 2 protein [Ferruginibacter sp.]